MSAQISSTAAAMCLGGFVVSVVGLVRLRTELAAGRGPDRILALSHVCFAVPLAVFGALHLFGPQFVSDVVPLFMPWRMFCVYFVGAALLAASLSIAARIEVGLSGFLFGVMMFLFVAMVHLPGAISHPENRIVRTIVFREMSFGGGGWILAGLAIAGRATSVAGLLVAVGRAFVTLAMTVFGIEHFLHPMVLPVVPLEKAMPIWVPAGMAVDYVTGAALLLAAGSVVLNRHARTALTGLAVWILTLVVVIYTPLLILALMEPAIGTQVEGVNYFADTLLFAGAVLALARATQPSTGR
ncbi:MAG: hypothetical protein ABI672_18295 [Vicinamibacteria bacterium]